MRMTSAFLVKYWRQKLNLCSIWSANEIRSKKGMKTKRKRRTDTTNKVIRPLNTNLTIKFDL